MKPRYTAEALGFQIPAHIFATCLSHIDAAQVATRAVPIGTEIVTRGPHGWVFRWQAVGPEEVEMIPRMQPNTSSPFSPETIEALRTGCAIETFRREPTMPHSEVRLDFENPASCGRFLEEIAVLRRMPMAIPDGLRALLLEMFSGVDKTIEAGQAAIDLARAGGRPDYAAVERISALAISSEDAVRSLVGAPVRRRPSSVIDAR